MQENEIFVKWVNCLLNGWMSDCVSEWNEQMNMNERENKGMHELVKIKENKGMHELVNNVT